LATGVSGVAQSAAATSKLPCFPTASGECDVTAPPSVGNAPVPATPAVGGYETASTNSAKKYQYWSVKV